MTHIELVNMYLASKRNAWRPLTVRATASRLKHYQESPDSAFEALKAQGAKPYYIKQVWVSICAYQEWLIAQGRAASNPHRQWMKDNAQLFRNAYEDKYTQLTWTEFLDEYRAADCEQLKSALVLMGYGACRLAELYTYDPLTSTVIGKGAKRRRVHIPSDIPVCTITLSRGQLRKALRYNPHSYRKLAADRYLRGGLDIKTVQVLLGHSSILSTQRYLRPMESDALKEKLELSVWRSA